MSHRTCSNHVDYGRDGDPEAWGARVCGALSVRDCTRCHAPACPKHLDLDPDTGSPRSKPVCMDCHLAGDAAVAQNRAIAGAVNGAKTPRLPRRSATTGRVATRSGIAIKTPTAAA